MRCLGRRYNLRGVQMKTFPKHKVVGIDGLIPYALNSRTHSDAQVAQIAASIKEFGFLNPIIIDGENGIIAGHGRVLAAQKLGMTELPVVEADHLTDAQRKAYVIADNRLALNAGWDDEILSTELSLLKDDDFDLSLLGFDDKELSDLLGDSAEEGLTDPEDIPDTPENATTIEGDIWILGKHRLMCSDSTKMPEIEKLMSGSRADMIFTDPPYNVNYEGGTGMKIKNDHMGDSLFRQFLKDSLSCAYEFTKAGRPIYIAHADSEGYNFRGAMVEAGFLFKQCIIWVKNSMVLGRQDYQWQHEPILYGWKDGEAHKWYGDFNKKTVIDDDIDIKKLDKKELLSLINKYRNSHKTTVVREDKPHKNDIHPTMKPVALVEQFIRNSSREEDIVLDSFAGGGSTLIACQKLNRICRTMELDPKYCDVIIKRWQDFTGQEAVLESTGEKYNDMYINGRKGNHADANLGELKVVS